MIYKSAPNFFIHMPAHLISLLREAAPVIVSLILIEGLLSVDNILAIAALAAGLPQNKRKSAMRLGLAGAYVWRGVALLGASVIVDHPWLKLLGALYLIHIMVSHFGEMPEADGEQKSLSTRTFFSTVLAIQFLDLSLSVDNVVTAVVMSPKLWVVCTGVGLGLLTLWIFASMSLRLVERFPILKHAAFLLVGYVGLLLIAEMAWHLHLNTLEKFYGIAFILAVSVWYSKSAVLRKILTPPLKLALWPMRFYEKSLSRAWGLVFGT